MSNNRNYALGFFDILTIIFITLKLLGVIHWSWIWVLFPLWGSFVLILIIALIGIISITGFKIKRGKKK